MQSETTVTLFFALWPSAHDRARLGDLARALAREVGGRPIAAERIHLTLTYLGAAPRDRLEAVKSGAQSASGTACDLVLDRLGGFARQGIVWAGAGSPPSALGALQTDIAARMAAIGFTLESRPFVPHVTLVREARRAPSARVIAPPIEWRIDSFALVQSSTNPPRYTTLERFTLAAGL